MHTLEDRMRTRVTGLVLECPFGDPAPDCPLNELRKKSIRERVVEALTMEPKVLHGILEHHEWCSSQRERGEKPCNSTTCPHAEPKAAEASALPPQS